MDSGLKIIDRQLASFKKKYYLNLLIRGTILTFSLVLLYFLLVSVIEYNLWLSGGARFTILVSFFVLVAFCVYQFLRLPISWWLYNKGLDQKESAKLIGSHFPTIKDRLLNLLQLAEYKQESALLQAGIVQKSRMMENISFESAIDLGENKRYLKYFLAPFGILILLFFVNQGIFIQSTQRIVQFNRAFSPQAPFSFSIENKNLQAFFNEDFTLQLKLSGTALPTAVYIVSGSQRFKMEALSNDSFAYTFEKLQNEIPLQFEASGFYSDNHTIQLIHRPELTQLKITLSYPRYLGKQNDILLNTGNMEIPEGTQVQWQIKANNAVKAVIGFSTDETEIDMQLSDNQYFTHNQAFRNPLGYRIALQNDYASNKDHIAYAIQIIKDQHPQITIDHLRDSVLYKSIYLGGFATDDHGITALTLNYQRVGNEASGEVHSIALPVNKNQLQQSFFYPWSLDSLALQPGEKVNYYLEVWDNDDVNGHKSTRSATYVFALPSKEEIKEDIAHTQQVTNSKIDESLRKAQEIRKSIDEAEQKLKGKQTLEWQDKKALEEIIRQKEALNNLIEDLQKQNALMNEKKESFSEQDEKIKEKAAQLQKLMDDLLDEETKKLLQEMEKLLRENADLSQIKNALEKLDRKELNLEKELERTLALFKQLQFEDKLDQAIQEIKEQAKKQEELLEKTKEAAGEKDNATKENEDQKDNKKQDQARENNPWKDKTPKTESLAKEQEDLSKDFDQFEKTLEELSQIGQEIEEDVATPAQEEIDQVKDSQQQSKESLENGNPKKAIDSQKKSVQKMKEMQQQMEGMQSGMQMEIDMGNLESLRHILHGLIKLSFDQELLMTEFNQIQQTDPKYVQHGQQQLKIKDDYKVLEDSLLALSKRDPFMGSIVTREIGELNQHVEKAVENIRERKKGNAGAEMQMSMTSINNLALMLNDHFDMMMDMMANAKPSKGKGKKSKNQPGLSEMQRRLNEEIEQLKNSGKTGRQMSEELARMAAEQERIRRALQEMQEKLQKEGGKVPGGDLGGKMEQTEMDLVNKQLTEQTIRRQKDILTRLLEAEKSMREQDLDEERKGETAKDYQREIPKAFEEYLRLKEKEVELLKTVPPKLFPYYKKEVSEYFKRIENFE